MKIQMEIDTSDKQSLSEAFDVLALFVDGKPEAPAKKAAAPKATPEEKVTETVGGGDAVTLADIKAVGRKLIADGKRDEFLALLQEFDATGIGKLAAEHYHDFMERAEKL